MRDCVLICRGLPQPPPEEVPEILQLECTECLFIGWVRKTSAVVNLLKVYPAVCDVCCKIARGWHDE